MGPVNASVHAKRLPASASSPGLVSNILLQTRHVSNVEWHSRAWGTELELFRSLPFYHFNVSNYKSSRQTFQKMSEWGNCWHLQDQRCTICHFSLKFFKHVHQEVLGSLGRIKKIPPFKISEQSWPAPPHFRANLAWASWVALQHLLLSVCTETTDLHPFKKIRHTWSSSTSACLWITSVSVCQGVPAWKQLSGAFITILMLVCSTFFPL